MSNPTVTAENAANEIERRLNEVSALCALFIDAKVDPRAWAQLMIYAPPEAIEGNTARRILKLESKVGEMRAQIAMFMTWMASLEDGAREIIAGRMKS